MTQYNPFYVPDGVAFGDQSIQTTAFSNAVVAANLADFGNNSVSTTGNITAAHFNGNGANLTSVTVDWANVVGANAGIVANLAALGDNPISTTNTVTAGNALIGNISIVGNTVGSLGDEMIIDPLLDGNPLTGNVLLYGNLSITGNVTYNDVTTSGTANLLWIAADTAQTAANASGGGIAVGDVANGYNFASWTFDSVSNAWLSSLSITTNDNVSALGNVIGGNINTANVVSAGGNVIAPFFNGVLANGTSNIGIPVADGNIIAYVNGASAFDLSETVIAVGTAATGVSPGAGAIAIGAFAADDNQSANSIVINANATPILAGVAGLFIDPVRNDLGNTANVLYYNEVTKEITFAPAAEVYGNANVANFLANFGSNVISTSGNINAGNFNAANSVNAVGNIDGNNVNATNSVVAIGNIDGGNLNTANIVSAGGNIVTGANVIATGNVDGNNINVSNVISAAGNILTGGDISAVGNLSGGYLLGNAYYVSSINAANIVGSYDDANVATFLGNLNANVISSNAAITTTSTVAGNVVQYQTLAATGTNQASTTYQIVISNATPATVSIPAQAACDYTWVIESSMPGDATRVMSKGFLVADEANANIVASNYGWTSIGPNTAGLTIPSVAISGTGPYFIDFTFGTPVFGTGNLILTTTQYAV